MAFRSSNRAIALGLSFAMLASSGDAFAAPDRDGAEGEESDEARVRRADELVHEGVQARLRGDERAALERFRRAYDVSPSPRARAQMGLAAKSLRLYLEAESYLREALEARTDPWMAEHQETLEQALDFVDRQLAWVVIVAVRPADVEVVVNGRALGHATTGARLRVVAGEVVVELRASGFRSYAKRVDAVARTTTTINADLVAAGAADESLPAPAPLPAESGRTSARRISFYASAAVTVIAAGAGTYFGIRAVQLKNERDDLCPTERCASARGVELDGDGRMAGTWATVAFGTAAIAAGVAIWFFVTDRRAAPPAPRVALSW
jgi:hypothetical protein